MRSKTLPYSLFRTDNLPAIAWTARPDGLGDFINRRLLKNAGPSFEEALGKDFVAIHALDFHKKESLTMTGNPSSVIPTAVFDTKPYDREALQQASANHGIEWHFLEFRLSEDSASAAKNARAVCVFVNDQLNRPCLEVLASLGVELAEVRH